jgi:hypothetical protein
VSQSRTAAEKKVVMSLKMKLNRIWGSSFISRIFSRYVLLYGVKKSDN